MHSKILKIYTISTLAILAFYSIPAFSEIYRWTDADGNVQFGDRPPSSLKARPIELKINSYESVTIEPFVPFKSGRPYKSKAVILYSTAWCGYCRKARNYLKENKIPFEEYDVEKSDKGKRDYERLNGRGVPILLIGDQRMNGFSVARFRKLYDG